MKNIFRVPTLLLAMLLITFCFFACDKGNGLSDTGENTNESGFESQNDPPVAQTYTFVSGGKSDYMFVTPKYISEDILSSTRAINNVLSSKANINLESKTDETSSDKEIIIGNADREEVRELFSSLKFNDYIVTVKNGKLIILGGSDSATLSGAMAFSRLINSDTVEYKEGEVILKYEDSYRLSSVKLNGSDISEYTIRYESYAESRFGSAAEILQKRIQGLYGITVPIVSGNIEVDSAKEIILGNCGQSSFSEIPALSGGEYVLYTSGSKIVLNGSNVYAVKAAMSKFCNTYLPMDAKGDVVIDVSDEIKVLKGDVGKYPLTEGASIRIMSNNILGDSTLTSRAPLIVGAYLEYMPAIIGLQECNANGYSQVIDKLKDYYAVATGNIEGKNTKSYTPILYLKGMYNVIDTGTFFYDMRYMKTNTKTLSWAVFETIETGKKFIVMNTHCAIIADSYNLAPMTNAVEGALWREDNSRQILEQATLLKEKYGDSTPVVFMGDMNANKNAKSIKMLEEYYADAVNVAIVSASGNVGSSHGVGVAPPNGKLPIDHVFVDTKTVTVYKHNIPSNSDMLKISDHTPVVVDISFK